MDYTNYNEKDPIDALIVDARVRLTNAIENGEPFEIIDFLKQDLEDLKERQKAFYMG